MRAVLLFTITVGLSLSLLVWSQRMAWKFAAAGKWQAIPCEMLPGSTGKAVRYTYQLGDKSYEGSKSRLFEISGLKVGDEAAWIAWLEKSAIPGTKAVCYVNPADHSESVLDRSHGRHQPGNMVLLAHVYLSILIWVSFFSFYSGKSTGAAENAKRIIGLINSKSPPRVIPFLAKARLILGHKSVVFFALATVTSAVVFAIMGGPSLLPEFPRANDMLALGNVVEATEPVQETAFFLPCWKRLVVFSFEWDGLTLTGEGQSVTFSKNESQNPAVEVPIRIRNGDPSLAEIDGRQAPWLYHSISFIPGTICVFFGCCLVSAMASEWLVADLFISGVATVATNRNPPGNGQTHQPSVETEPNWIIRVDDKEFPVDPRTTVGIRSNNAPAVYLSHEPGRNGALDSQRIGELIGKPIYNIFIPAFAGNAYLLILLTWLVGPFWLVILAALAILGWFFLSRGKKEKKASEQL